MFLRGKHLDGQTKHKLPVPALRHMGDVYRLRFGANFPWFRSLAGGAFGNPLREGK